MWYVLIDCALYIEQTPQMHYLQSMIGWVCWWCVALRYTYTHTHTYTYTAHIHLSQCWMVCDGERCRGLLNRRLCLPASYRLLAIRRAYEDVGDGTLMTG